MLLPFCNYKVTSKSGYPSEVISPKWKRPGILLETDIIDLASILSAKFTYITLPESFVALSGGINISFIRETARRGLAHIFLV